MVNYGIPEKAIKKYHNELLDLNKRCCKTYLVQQGVKVGVRKKFFKLYDLYITEKNIIHYWPLPINLLVQSIVKDDLHIYFKYTDPNVSRHSKKSIHR